jgi:hypothetical protein
MEQLDPLERFRGFYEYRVVTQEGERLNLQPVRVATGMPDLKRVVVRPGVPGCKAQHTLGSRCIVGFIDADPARPCVVSFEDAQSGGFSPDTLFLTGGGLSPTEHVMTAEAVALLIYNTLAAICQANSGPLIGASLALLLSPAVLAAIAAQGAPAPPGLAAQIAAATAQAGNFSSGLVASTSQPFNTAIDRALAGKTDDVSAFFPSLGCKAVKSS